MRKGYRCDFCHLGFTFAGWLLLVCCVGGFVLDIISMGAFKRSKNAMGLN